ARAGHAGARCAAAACGDGSLSARAQPDVRVGCRNYSWSSAPVWRLAPDRVRSGVLVGVPGLWAVVRRAAAGAIVARGVRGLSRERAALDSAPEAVARDDR